MDINTKDRRSERKEVDYDDMEVNDTRESTKHRSTSKDTKKSSRREETDYRTKDKDDKCTDDYDKDNRRERRNEDKDDRGKDKHRDRDYDREKHRDKESRTSKELDRKDRGKETNDRGRDKESGKEKSIHRDKEREKSKERGKHNDQETGKENVKGRTVAHDKERTRDGVSRRNHDEEHDKDHTDKYTAKKSTGPLSNEDGDGQQNDEVPFSGQRQSEAEIKERILKMKEQRLKPKAEAVPELLAWVNKSRKLEEKKKTEKEKALMLSKIFEEQDNIDQGEDDDVVRHTSEELAGFKILHGLDKVMEGGAVVLTLKDQNILANGDINEDIDMLENVEIGEQKRREEAYKAANKKTGGYEDKFNEIPGAEKKMLAKYDDPVADEGVTLDQLGKFTGEAEKKLDELRRRIEGGSVNNHFEDLNSSGKISSDYYTNDEMSQFKKPKKKKSLRRKDKLDLDALEAEAVSAGLGMEDLGSRNDARKQAIKEEQRKFEAEKKSSAYQSAYAKANEASKALLEEHTMPVKKDEGENAFFADDEGDELYKSLERARNLALKRKNEEKATGPEAIALLATTAKHETTEDETPTSGEPRENKVVFTEMEEFVWGLQLDEEDQKTYNEDVFMEEDEAPEASNPEVKDGADGWSEVKDTGEEETSVDENKSEIVRDETIHEVPVGKGLGGALKLLKERGTLKETVEWGGRNMDKKKSKLVGIYESDGKKEINIERIDEFGRIMTPKEAFRTISHKFHGKGPGKQKLEKRQKQFHEEQKLKQMKNSDTPSHSVERMREAQLQSKSPYLVISGHVRPGQTSDPQSGFATVEKDLPGGLTPMLGDRKVEYLMGMKHNPSRLGDMGPPKKKPKN